MSEDRKDKRTREGVLLCEAFPYKPPNFSKFLDIYLIEYYSPIVLKPKESLCTDLGNMTQGWALQAGVIIVISATSRACVKFLMVNIF